MRIKPIMIALCLMTGAAHAAEPFALVDSEILHDHHGEIYQSDHFPARDFDVS